VCCELNLQGHIKVCLWAWRVMEAALRINRYLQNEVTVISFLCF